MKIDNPDQRNYTWQDRLILGLHQCIRTAFNLPPQVVAARAYPAQAQPDGQLNEAEQQHSAALMRINHTGEVCAQALYFGQSMTARNNHIQNALSEAAQEEYDHLSWCAQRIQELNSHTSYLNPLWYTGSFCIGLAAGMMGDRWNLGFLAETENQVYQHLSTHLDQLPSQDNKSRLIVSQMQIDEAKHATTAMNEGAADLPAPIKLSMRWMAKVMTTIVYYL